MSVLIKGVDMPTSRPLLMFVHSDGMVEVHEVHRYGWQTLQNVAVPIPPHGRLIDADAIRLPQGFFGRVQDVPTFYRWLNALPTIIEAEEKNDGKAGDTDGHRAAKARAAIHAKWKIVVPTPQSLVYAICSNCGKATAMRPEIKNCCPNCGARMDEEGE